MLLELNDDEALALRDAVSSTVSDLSPEIADTDNPRYRRELKARRDLLSAVVRQLDAHAS